MQSCINGASSMPYTLEQDITAAARAGFAAVELWGSKFDPYFRGHSIADLGALLASHNLQPAAIDYVAVDLNSPEPLVATLQTLKRYGEIAQGIGCRTVLTIVQGQRPELLQGEVLNFLVKLMLPLCDAAARFGLRLALEPLGRDPLIAGPSQALEIIRVSKRENLGLSWDFFHSHKSGVPLAAVRRIPRERLYIVHASDVPDKDPATLRDSDRLWPGEGVLSLDDYFEVLRDLRYAGPVSVEAPNPAYWGLDPDSLAQEAHESLEVYLPVRIGG